MSNIYSKKTVYIILISVAFLTGIVVILYIHSGRLLFGNIINSTLSFYSSSDKTQDHDIPEFYKTLLKEKGDFSIIEYPPIIQDRYNHFPYYQSFHQKNILNGYFLSHALKKQWKAKNIFETNVWPVEIILSRLENNKLNFSKLVSILTNFINLYDINTLRNSGAKYIILHKNIKDEIIATKNNPHINKDLSDNDKNQLVWQHIYKFTSHFRNYYARYFGEAIFEDKFVVVFQIK